MTGFDELDDAAKVKYSQAELAATYDELTNILDRLAALRTEGADAGQAHTSRSRGEAQRFAC